MIAEVIAEMIAAEVEMIAEVIKNVIAEVIAEMIAAEVEMIAEVITNVNAKRKADMKALEKTNELNSHALCFNSQ
jgi:phosphoenolpyruvate carboxylase